MLHWVRAAVHRSFCGICFNVSRVAGASYSAEASWLRTLLFEGPRVFEGGLVDSYVAIRGI